VTDLLIACPVPVAQYDRIVLGHGSGGRLTADLVSRVFLPAFKNHVLTALEDQATVSPEHPTNRRRMSLPASAGTQCTSHRRPSC
jgi:hypothetical protein